MRKFFSEVVLPAATGHGLWNGKKGLLKTCWGGIGFCSLGWAANSGGRVKHKW